MGGQVLLECTQKITNTILSDLLFFYAIYNFFCFDYKEREPNDKHDENLRNRLVGVIRNKKIIITFKRVITRKDMLFLFVIILLLAHF